VFAYCFYLLVVLIKSGEDLEAPRWGNWPWRESLMMFEGSLSLLLQRNNNTTHTYIAAVRMCTASCDTASRTQTHSRKCIASCDTYSRMCTVSCDTGSRTRTHSRMCTASCDTASRTKTLQKVYIIMWHCFQNPNTLQNVHSIMWHCLRNPHTLQRKTLQVRPTRAGIC
jgi:hypothetical protein